MICDVCETALATAEGVWVPTRADTLFQMAHRYRDDFEQWPSIWMCDICAQRSDGVFASLGELEPEQAIQVTSTTLRDLARIAVQSQAFRDALRSQLGWRTPDLSLVDDDGATG